MMWELEEEFALEALAASDSWDARAGRVFTFPPLSALWHPWGLFPAEQVLGGGSGELGASAGPTASSAAGDACGDRDVGWGSHGPKPNQPCVCVGLEGWGLPGAHSTSPPASAPLWLGSGVTGDSGC